MRWWTAGCCALALLALTGCPETYRRGGRADRAIRKDMKELVEPNECTKAEHDLYCADDEESEECLEHCG